MECDGKHVLRRDNGDVLRRALDFEVAGRRGRGRPNVTWKRQVAEHIIQIGLKREDSIDRVKWRNDVTNCWEARGESGPCINADKTGFKKLYLSLSLLTVPTVPAALFCSTSQQKVEK